MKKILYLAVCCALVASMGSCNKKISATPGAAAKQYAELIKNDNYGAFVRAIEFNDKPAVKVASTMDRAARKAERTVKKEVDKTHATYLRTVHHPSVAERGGIKEVRLVSEKLSPDSKTCDVTLTNHYRNGEVENVNYRMVNNDKQWKIQVNPYKEIWTATNSNGDREVMKIREGREREFVKDKDNGERHFVKDITRRNGQVEVIKTLENGHRQREVIKNLEEGAREVDKLKVDGNKVGVKDIDRIDKEIVKEKENIDGEITRAREVIRK